MGRLTADVIVFFDVNLNFTSMNLKLRQRFLYMIQAESCLPDHLVSNESFGNAVSLQYGHYIFSTSTTHQLPGQQEGTCSMKLMDGRCIHEAFAIEDYMWYSYLSMRSQYVCVNGSSSDILPVTSGINASRICTRSSAFHYLH